MKIENAEFKKAYIKRKIISPSFHSSKIEQNGRAMTRKHSLRNEMGRPLSASSQRGFAWQDQLGHWRLLLIGRKCDFLGGLAFSGAWHSLTDSMKTASSSETDRL